MMNLIQEQLHSRALQLSEEYRLKEVELLSLLQEIEAQKVYLALGFSSLFTYCVSTLGLSEERAYTFINVQRKCLEVPALQKKIEAGSISLSKARRLTSVLTASNQDEWLKNGEELPKHELEKTIAAIHPEEVRESVRVVSEDRYALKLGISEELLRKLRRIQALLSNQRKKTVSLEDVLEFNAEEVLKKHDPLLKKEKTAKVLCPGQVGPAQKVVAVKKRQGLVPLQNSTPESTGGMVYIRTPIPARIKTAVLKRDLGQCQYQSKGHQCGSSFFIHLHHRKPVHLGGEHSVENLVVLCSKHHSFHHDTVSARN